ncbi:MAG: hypothetical protein R3C12_20270 [Planctomycetaceae bacterium]
MGGLQAPLLSEGTECQRDTLRKDHRLFEFAQGSPRNSPHGDRFTGTSTCRQHTGRPGEIPYMQL